MSYRAWRDAIGLHGHDLTQAEFEVSIGTTDRKVAEFWAPRLGTSADTLDGEAKEAFLARATELEVFADAVALRETIDVPVAIGTNSARWRLDAVLAATGLHRHFEVSITASDVANPKPAPDIYLRAFEGIGVAASRGMVLEDSPSGTKAAKATGAFVVAVDRGLLDPAALSSADRIVGTLHPRV